MTWIAANEPAGWFDYYGNGRIASPTSSGTSTTSERRLDPPPFSNVPRPDHPGVAGRLEFVDAPSHVEDLKRYRARGHAMAGNRIRIVTDHEADLIEVHPPSRGSVDMGEVTVERCPSRPGMGDGVAGSAGPVNHL